MTDEEFRNWRPKPVPPETGLALGHGERYQEQLEEWLAEAAQLIPIKIQFPDRDGPPRQLYTKEKLLNYAERQRLAVAAISPCPHHIPLDPDRGDNMEHRYCEDCRRKALDAVKL